MSKVTIHVVAKKAGVSIATASRALNEHGHSGSVNSSTRQRVLAAAQEMGYIPLTERRTRGDVRTKMLGCLVPDLTNPFYAELAQCIIDRARIQGFKVVVATAMDQENGEGEYEPDAVRFLLGQRVQGILAVPTVPTGSSPSLGVWNLILQHNMKLVFLDRDLDQVLPNVDTVTVDNRKGARDGTWHLFTNGHERIGILAGPVSASTLAARLQGFRDAHKDRGLVLDEKLIQYCTFDLESRLHAARNLLSINPRPTAIFASSNLLGEALLLAVREPRDREIAFPREISMVMFDDVPWARLMSPRITTVANPPASLAKTAIGLLTQRLNGPEVASARHIVLQAAEVQVRESVHDRLHDTIFASVGLNR